MLRLPPDYVRDEVGHGSMGPCSQQKRDEVRYHAGRWAWMRHVGPGCEEGPEGGKLFVFF